MGFSISSAGAIIFISLFVTIGLMYSAASNSAEKLNAAEQASSDAIVDQQNTALTITNTSWNGSNTTLTVEANNTGTATIALSETELLVDNDHVAQSSFDVLEINGSTDTDLWLPGETLRIEVSLSEKPDRVQVVGTHGVSDGEVV